MSVSAASIRNDQFSQGGNLGLDEDGARAVPPLQVTTSTSVNAPLDDAVIVSVGLGAQSDNTWATNSGYAQLGAAFQATTTETEPAPTQLFSIPAGTLETTLTTLTNPTHDTTNSQFWLSTVDLYPLGYTSQLASWEVDNLDNLAWVNSQARADGIAWGDYFSAVKARRAAAEAVSSLQNPVLETTTTTTNDGEIDKTNAQYWLKVTDVYPPGYRSDLAGWEVANLDNLAWVNSKAREWGVGWNPYQTAVTTRRASFETTLDRTNPEFWLPHTELYPPGYRSDLAGWEVANLDNLAWVNSKAREWGVGWNPYQNAVTTRRDALQASVATTLGTSSVPPASGQTTSSNHTSLSSSPNASSITELRALLGTMNLPDLYSLVPDLEVYPQGYWTDTFGGVLISSQQPDYVIEELDLAAFERSTAKAAGIEWDSYRALLQEIRLKEQFSTQEFANSEGGYGGAFGGEDELGHISDNWGNLARADSLQNYTYAPSNLAISAEALKNIYPNQFPSALEALNALQAGGFFKQTVVGLQSPDGTYVATASVTWIAINMGSDHAQRNFGGGGASGSWLTPAEVEAQKDRLLQLYTTQANRAAEQRSLLSENGYQYEIDGLGRTRSITGELKLEAAERNAANQLSAGVPDRLPSDHGGHYIAARFGGSAAPHNLFAQNANFNLSKYRKLENTWANALNAGESVKVNILPAYSSSLDRRPSSLVITYTVSGQLPKLVVFQNEAGGQ
jgi:hypothetical protein